MASPLLDRLALPHFDGITPEHALLTLEKLIAEYRRNLATERFRSEILEIDSSKNIMQAVIAFNGRKSMMDTLFHYNYIGLTA
jgi:Zn-dependent oligopeptidase